MLKLRKMNAKNNQKKVTNYSNLYCQPKLNGVKCLVKRVEDDIEIKDFNGKIIDSYAAIERAVNTFIPKDVSIIGYIYKDSEFHATDVFLENNKDLVFKDRLEQLLVLGKRAGITGAGTEFKVVQTLKLDVKEDLGPIKEYFSKLGFDTVELVPNEKLDLDV